MRNALITGATGQDGALLVEYQLHKGYVAHAPVTEMIEAQLAAAGREGDRIER